MSFDWPDDNPPGQLLGFYDLPQEAQWYIRRLQRRLRDEILRGPSAKDANLAREYRQRHDEKARALREIRDLFDDSMPIVTLQELLKRLTGLRDQAAADASALRRIRDAAG